MSKKVEAKFGKVSMIYNMPVIEIIIPMGGDNAQDDDTMVGYLAPFRGYKFQVSATPEGHNDMASTAVIGLGHLRGVMLSRDDNDRTHWMFRSNRESMGILEEVVAAYSLVAIEKFCHRNGVLCPSNMSVGCFNSNLSWQKFITACCKMIMTYDVLPDNYSFDLEESK